MKAVVAVTSSGGGDDGSGGESEKRERESRSLALEKAYVHDVYDQLSNHFSDDRYRPWPRVRSFLEQLEPGSIVCDAGCGNGKYLSINPAVFKVGSDRCASSVEAARRKDHEVLMCDALNLPYRDESFDAALSIAVIHHLATRDRRVRALRELARILRVGGRILITVWAKEQRHRKFESQDILVPWRTPDRSSSEEKSHDPDQEQTAQPQSSSLYHHQHSTATTTTNTSDEDVTHYHAYTQTSESDSCSRHSRSKMGAGSKCSDCPACLSVAEEGNEAFRRHQRHHRHHKGRSVDPHRPSCSSQSSSDLSSPSDSCYSFVRKALQKLASTRRVMGGGHYRRSWFNMGESLDHHSSQYHHPLPQPEAPDPSNELPIELRHLDSEEDGLVAISQPRSRSSPPSLMGGDSVVQLFSSSSVGSSGGPPLLLSASAGGSSSSISLPRRLSTSSLQAGGTTTAATNTGGSSSPSSSAQSHRSSTAGHPSGSSRSLSLSDLLHSLAQVPVGSWLKNRLSEEDPTTSSLSPASETTSGSVGHPAAPSPHPAEEVQPEQQQQPSAGPPQPAVRPRLRPLLIKQKRAVQIFESYCEEEDGIALAVPEAAPAVSGLGRQKVFKQGSMNDSLLSAGRLDERDRLKRSLFPRQTTWSGASSSSLTVTGSAREPSPLSHPPSTGDPPAHPAASQTFVHPASISSNKPPPSNHPPTEIGDVLTKDFASIRNGFARIWQSLRGEASNKSLDLGDRSGRPVGAGNKPWLLDSPTGEDQKAHQHPALQQHRPSLLEKRIKSFCGWATVESASATATSAPMTAASPSPRRILPSSAGAGGEEDFFNFPLPRCCAEQDLSYKFCTHPHRLSSHPRADAEGSSDSSSKDSSLQSDTSVDSEDSCVSVIYVPRPDSGALPDPSPAIIGTSCSLSGPEKFRKSSSSSSEGSPVVKVFPPTLLPITAEALETDQTLPPPRTPDAIPPPLPPPALPAHNKCLTVIREDSDGSGGQIEPSTTSSTALVRSSVPSIHHHRLLSFDVFNPETDDIDSDSDLDGDSSSESSSSSNSAGSVISVGDPMWPAFQDRRQTILSGSSLDIGNTSSCDQVSNSELAGDSSSLVLTLAKQDSSDSWPASMEADPAGHLAPVSGKANQANSPATGGQLSITNEGNAADLLVTYPSPGPPDSSSGLAGTLSASAPRTNQQEVEEWRLRSSLGPLDECREEEANEIGCLPETATADSMDMGDRLESSEPRMTVSQQTEKMLLKSKSSFSASTSSLDSSVSAPSFSSARQSSSASALSVDAAMRKNSDDSAVISTLPLLRPRPFALTSSAAHHYRGHHSVGGAAAMASFSSSGGGSGSQPSRSASKPSCDSEDGPPHCFNASCKPLNKLITSTGRQRSADRDSSLSVSTSQDSLPSDAGGGGGEGGGAGGQSGTVTLHRYYHVFRQGELDQLIERYVENLHIITSYYDHANWCVVAEKVHVWTI